MIDLTAIVSSVIGSLIVGILLVTSAPLWWRKWVSNVTKLKKALGVVAFIVVILGGIALAILGLDYIETKSIPPNHPGLTNEEVQLARAECEMKSIEASADILSRSERSWARQRYRAACLIEKGFRWE